jgi:Undecaprenyl-phosphate glucose phosphotransferase
MTISKTLAAAASAAALILEVAPSEYSTKSRPGWSIRSALSAKMALLDQVHPELSAISRVPSGDVGFGFGVPPQALVLVDAACIVVLGIACGVAYNAAVSGQVGDVDRYFGFGITIAILFSACAHARCSYSRFRLQQLQRQIKEVVLVWSLAFLCLLPIAFALKASDALFHGTVISFFLTGLGALVLLRWSTKHVLARASRSGALGKRPVIVVAQSEGPALTSIAQAIEANGYNISQIILLPAMSNKLSFAECMRELIDYVRRHPVGEILLATNWRDASLIEAITGELRVVPLPVKLIPDAVACALLRRPLVEFGNTRAVELQGAPLSWAQRAAKRLLDLVVTVLALPLLLPLLGVTAMVIALDSRGPVLFRQRRIGFNGREFHIYKFRTMKTLEDGAIIRQACQGDQRITRIGRLLRRFSIDELPQLLNVLKGEMSLVGPRPHAWAHDREYGQMVHFYAARHNVKPGVTGWAQVNGWRGATPQLHMMVRRVEHDLWYIEHWSFWLDIKILVATVMRVCRSQNAY